MPRRIVSIRRRAEVSGLRSEWVEFLFSGSLFVQTSAFPEPSLSDAKTMWARHRGQLLRWWLGGIPADAFRRVHFGLEAYNKPHPAGTRPWAWWKFYAPDDKRRLLAVVDMVPREGTPFHDFIERAPTAEDCANAWRHGEGDFRLPEGESGVSPYRFETEAEYLERHGLLTKVERKAIIAEKLPEGDTDGNA